MADIATTMLEQEYWARRRRHEEILAHLAKCVRRTLDDGGVPASVTWRVKSYDSLRAKLAARAVPADDGPSVTLVPDLLGMRVVCPFLSELVVVERLLVRYFEVLDVERKAGGSGYREFGYESVHLLLGVPVELTGCCGLPDDLRCEVQLRTVLQNAWAEIEHELVYKPAESARPADEAMARRKLGAISATLALLDQTVQEIRGSSVARARRLEPNSVMWQRAERPIGARRARRP